MIIFGNSNFWLFHEIFIHQRYALKTIINIKNIHTSISNINFEEKFRDFYERISPKLGLNQLIKKDNKTSSQGVIRVDT